MIKVGVISQRVVELLNIDVDADTPIYIGETNENHMKEKHPNEYEVYRERISDIIKMPDYVGKKPGDGSIEYVKMFVEEGQHVKVAVRVSSGGVYYARSLFARDSEKIERFVGKGYLIKY